MKSIITASLVSILLSTLCVGQNVKTFTIPAGSHITEVVPPTEVYLYPSFTVGRVYYKDEGRSSGRLNYNILLGQIQFIDDKGDTLSLINEGTIDHITINQDTFYYSKYYLQKIGGNDNIKLAAQKIFSQVEKRKMGAYGQTTSTEAITTYSSIAVNGQVKDLTVQEEVILAKTANYFLGDRYNNFSLFNKKNLLKYFSRNENEIKNYLDTNKVQFNKEDDLKKLMLFLQTLK